MYDIEIKKGRTFRYDLWYGGEPPPNVIWERNGIVLQGLLVGKVPYFTEILNQVHKH